MRWLGACLLASLLVLCELTPARADSRFRLRTALGAGLMMSRDQRADPAYAFDKIALLGSIHGEFALRPWLELRAGAQTTAFFSSRHGVGGLLTTTLGPLLRAPQRLSPYVALALGAGLTERLVRPFFSLEAGLDCRLSERTALGPVFGYGQLVQRNGPQYTSDARYFWLGSSLRVRFGVSASKPVTRAPQPAQRPVTPPVAPAAEEPSEEVVELIERALPSSQRVELLAPVLFELDSAELSANAVAMLHEVASALRAQASIELVEIRGYADRRGSSEHNRELSQRRAERVREWLIEHGIAAERLTLSSHGASELVEGSDDASAHEQNRRVVFRVLKEASR